MPEEDVTTTREVPAAPDTGAGAPGESGADGLNVGLAVLFVVIVTLVAVQNLWLRRRAEREARSGGDSG